MSFPSSSSSEGSDEVQFLFFVADTCPGSFELNGTRVHFLFPNLRAVTFPDQCPNNITIAGNLSVQLNNIMSMEGFVGLSKIISFFQQQAQFQRLQLSKQRKQRRRRVDLSANFLALSEFPFQWQQRNLLTWSPPKVTKMKLFNGDNKDF